MEASTRLAFTHFESQNKQLDELMEELMRDKHEVLNGIVSDYMAKSYMFHKKANLQF